MSFNGNRSSIHDLELFHRNDCEIKESLRFISLDKGYRQMYSGRYSDDDYWESLLGKSIDKVMELFDGRRCSTIGKSLGHDLKTMRRFADVYIGDYKENKTRSEMEYELELYLNSIGIEYISNNRSVLSPRELDFYLPDCKLAIEMNGLFWHSLEHDKENEIKHRQKYLDCKELGISLIQIWEHDWQRDSEYWSEIILNRINNHIWFDDSLIELSCDLGFIDIPGYELIKEEVSDILIEGRYRYCRSGNQIWKRKEGPKPLS